MDTRLDDNLRRLADAAGARERSRARLATASGDQMGLRRWALRKAGAARSLLPWMSAARRHEHCLPKTSGRLAVENYCNDD